MEVLSLRDCTLLNPASIIHTIMEEDKQDYDLYKLYGMKGWSGGGDGDVMWRCCGGDVEVWWRCGGGVV